MNPVVRWSVRNRAVVDIVVIAWIIGGIFAFTHIRRELFPEFSFDAIQVETILPGATSEDVERLVTDPIEDVLVDLSGIDRVESTSTAGRSSIWVFVDPDGGEIDEVLKDIERAVDTVDNLPEDSEDPVIRELKAEERVVVVALRGDAPWSVRKKISDRMKDRLRSVPGVANVIVAGLERREIAVDLKPARLAYYGLSAGSVAAAIRNADADLPAGLVAGAGGDVRIRTVGRLGTPEEVAEIIVRSGNDGLIKIGDIAEVGFSLADERTRSRVSGARAINFTVMKANEGDILKIAADIARLVSEENRSLPDGLGFEAVQDASTFVQERLDVAYQSGAWGFVLVFLLLAVFLDPLSAAWCAYGIPIAILGSIIIMYVTGSTLNMLTIFGFILVIGMLVDDAIVVVENVARHRENGASAADAVMLGASEVARPVTAAVLTTIAALLPMALMSGIMGKFMSEIPKPGIFALLASLVEAVITLPAHLYVSLKFGRPFLLRKPLKYWDRVREVGNNVMAFLRHYHGRGLLLALRRRYLFLTLIVIVFLAATAAGVMVLRFELVSTNDMPMFIVELEGPAGMTLDEMEEITGKVEEAVRRLPAHEIKSISSTIGIRIDMQHGVPEYGRELAQVMVELADPKVRPRVADDIKDELRPYLREIKGADIVISKMEGGPPVGPPISVRLSSDEWPLLRSSADQVREFIEGLPGVTDIKDDLRVGNEELVVEPMPEATALVAGLPRDIAMEVRAAVDGIEATSVRIGEDEIDIRVRYAKENRAGIADISSIQLSTPFGPTPITQLANLSRERGYTAVHHYNGKRTVTVTAEIMKSGIASNKANRKILESLQENSERRGVYLDLGGENEDTEKSMTSIIGASGFCISLIAIILVFQFGNFLQPLAVLSALPLAVIGVILTLIGHTVFHEATGFGFETPMGLMPLIGLLALLGVIVNDSIVLVDFINQSRRRGAGRWRSILVAGRHRIRPVILTSLTTSAGILPMAYTLRGSSSFLAPMAISFGWGLLFGTVLTLFVVPTFTAILDDFRRTINLDET